MVRYEAVVFDMDGVLFDTETVSKRGWTQVGREMNLPDIEEALRCCTGVTRPFMRAFLTRRYGPDFSYEAFRARTEELFQQTIAREGVRLMPGVRGLLEYLRAQGKGIAIASSSDKAAIVHHLDEHGLRPYFDAIISGDQVQNGKPHPEIYLRACAMLGREPARCIAVEDSPNGIRSAHAAGMMPVMVPDQIAPTNEIRALAYAIRGSLTAVREWLAQGGEAEMLDVFDAQGRRTGETVLRGEPLPAGRYTAVAEVFVRHADGAYLFMQRAEEKIGCPGLWECGAGGSVRHGEEIEKAAWRELAEETGLTRGVLRPLGQRTDGQLLLAHYLLFTHEAKEAVRLQPGETAGCRWLSPEAAAEFVQSDACVPFLKVRFAQYEEEMKK